MCYLLRQHMVWIFIVTGKSGRARDDGRQPILLYMKPEVIKALKARALTEDTYSYLIAEQTLQRELGVPESKQE